MTDRLRRGGVSKGQQHRPFTPTLRGRIGNGRCAVYDPDPARLLPDWECEHGRLEGDSSEVCGCFRDEALTRVRLRMAETQRLGGLALQAKIRSGEIDTSGWARHDRRDPRSGRFA